MCIILSNEGHGACVDGTLLAAVATRKKDFCKDIYPSAGSGRIRSPTSDLIE